MERARLGSWAAVGSRIALARERAGFTQQAVAERLGLHRTAITRIEQGQRNLDALELAQLADVFGRSVEWFVTEPPSSIASHRDGLSANSDVVRLEDELERCARDVELLLDIDAFTVPAARLPAGVTTTAEAEAGARDARALLGLGEGPIVDLQQAVQPLGLLAFSLDLGSDVVDGGYVRLHDIGVAVVNGTSDPGRRRFSLAHELGHHLLADEYTTDFGLGSSRSDREALINVFAVHFLMPGSSVRARWQALSPEHDVRRRLVVLAAEYRVSWSAVIAQAVNLELIGRDERATLEHQRPTRADYFDIGVRFEEELVAPAFPPVYAQAAVRAYRRSVISGDRAVELLRGTITAEDLPLPRDVPIDALVPSFDELG